MTDKEKLIEILQYGMDKYFLLKFEAEIFADLLISCGVTFAKDMDVPSKWVSVEDEMPESEKIVLASAKNKIFGYRHTLMVAHIGHHEATTEDSGWREYYGDTEYDEENDCFWVPECWWEVNSVEDNGNWVIDDDYVVTHWMPLPEPPMEV